MHSQFCLWQWALLPYIWRLSSRFLFSGRITITLFESLLRAVLVAGVIGTLLMSWQIDELPLWTFPPLILMALAVVLAHQMHQENAFKAVDFPAMADEPLKLSLQDNMELAVIECDGVTKAYPLDYVIHHHIINDRFDDRLVALTYCAMCHSIIPFDVTDIGPLFVGSFKTRIWLWLTRKLKPFSASQLWIGYWQVTPVYTNNDPFQVLTGVRWKAEPCPKVVRVTKQDFKAFELPVKEPLEKGYSEWFDPGLSSKTGIIPFRPERMWWALPIKSLTRRLCTLKTSY